MQKIKRAVAALLVALTLLSCNVTGFAAARKPTMTVTKKVSTITRGKKATVKFALKSGSYTRKKFYRAAWTLGLVPASSSPASFASGFQKKNIHNTFTGKKNLTMDVGTGLPRSHPTGKFYMVFFTHYRTRNTVKAWTLNKASIDWFKVTIK